MKEDTLFPVPKRAGRRGKPFRESEPTVKRINVGVTEGQMDTIKAGFPDRKPVEVVLLALAEFVPDFQTEVKP